MKPLRPLWNPARNHDRSPHAGDRKDATADCSGINGIGEARKKILNDGQLSFIGGLFI